MKVLKFGGSSVATPERIRQVASIIQKKSAESPITVVISAMGNRIKGELKVTDQLKKMGEMAAAGNEAYKDILRDLTNRHHQAIVELVSEKERDGIEKWFAKEIAELTGLLEALPHIRELSLSVLDYLMGFGERLAAAIVAAALRSQGLRAHYLDMTPLIETDEQFGQAEVNDAQTDKKIAEYIKEKAEGEEDGDFNVATGFVASTATGRPTTLGRDGSDKTAALIGRALKAEVVEIWKDVDGAMTANPEIVEDAETIAKLTFREARELTTHGGKWLMPDTMGPLEQIGIPLIIKNTLNPEHPGTVIHAETNGDKRIVKGISSLSKIALFNVVGPAMQGRKGLLKRVTGAVADADSSVIFAVQVSSEQSISLAVPEADAAKVKAALENELATELEKKRINAIERHADKTMIAIVGEKMKGQIGTLAKVTGTLAENGINIVSIGQSPDEFNITVVVDRGKEADALRALHEAFLHPERITLNLFVVGSGQIAQELLRQIEERQKDQTKKSKEEKGENNSEPSINVRVVGIVNSTRTVLNKAGVPLQRWQEELKAGKEMNVQQAFAAMKDWGLPNTVFADCSDSEAVARLYPEVLRRSTHLAAANKIGFASELDLYNDINAAARAGKVMIKKKTTVGAGLPIVSTLASLRASRDRIDKILAVLSGTLSYIFNTYDGSIPFSQLVRSAKEKGITEPNPRTDLSMKDAGRKLLILARDAGLPLEKGDVDIQQFLSPEAQAADVVEEFFDALEAVDDAEMLRRYQNRPEGTVLRCIASLEHGKAKIELQEVGPNHPLYHLSGTENKVSFKTRNYETSPLTIQGPGAGREVTAASMLGDIIEIGDAISKSKR